MSKILGNRILKSPYVVLDQQKVVTINNETFIPRPLVPVEEEEEEYIFDGPGDIFAREIMTEEAELSEQELATKIVERAKAEADVIIQSAKDDADVILDQMEAHAQEALRQLEERARALGYSDGHAKGVAETEAIKQDARTLYANAERECKESFEGMEGEILELIIDVLDKLLTDAVNINPQVILYLIRKGFSDTRLSGDISIHVSDEDYDEVYANRAVFEQYAEAGSKLEVLKDYSLKKSDCIIETPLGAIDCSLDQQYEALKKNLYYMYENR